MRVARVIGVCMGAVVCAGSALGQADGRVLFITNRDSASVSSLRVNNDGSVSLIGAYPVDGPPQDCALSPDGTRLIVLNSDPNQAGSAEIRVMVVNADGSLGPPSAPRTVSDAPMALGVSRSGFVLVPSTVQQNLTSLRLLGTEASVVNTAPAGAFPRRPAATPDSRFVFCTSSISPDDVVRYSLAADGTLARLSALDIPGSAAFGVAMHPSGNVLYVSTGQANTIHWFTINQTTGVLTPGGSINPGGNSATELAATPDARWLLSVQVLSDTVHVSKINADGSLTPTAFSAAITADARHVVTDGRYVYVSDESPIGGAVGVHAFALNRDFGFLTPLGPAVATGGFKPQFMALWAPPVCDGDANGDRRVDFRDVTAVLTNFGLSGSAGDANFDGVVNFTDATTVLQHWGSTCGQ